MIRYLTVDEVFALHHQCIQTMGGREGVRDAGALASSLSQPHQALYGTELYPTLPEKAAALAFFLNKNHPFYDGNKRLSWVAMETFLLLNGYELVCDDNDAEFATLSVANGTMSKEQLTAWIQRNLVSRTENSDNTT